jgi:DNA invertase Pin-like site-specific DNA recombinase
VQEFTDKASGKRGDRVQFQAMFEAASRREFDAVLFWSLDRFTREGTLPTLQYLQRLDSYGGVACRSFTESWLDSLGPFKDVVLALLATLAEQERVRLSERVTAGLARRPEGRPHRWRSQVGRECQQDSQVGGPGAQRSSDRETARL